MLALFESIWLLPLVAAVCAGALAVVVLLRPWAGAFHRRVALVLGLTAVMELGYAALLFVSVTSRDTITPSRDAVFCRQAVLSLEFLRMAALSLAGAALIGDAASDARARRRAWITVAVGALGALLSWWGGFGGIDEMSGGAGLIRLGLRGWVLHVALLLGLVLALAQLESVLRASRDPFRFRIKFVILGLCALAGFELYVTSQTLLLEAWRVFYAAQSGIVTLASVAMVAFGFGRLRLAQKLGRVSVSPQALYGSLTLLGVGLYLLGLGLLGAALRLSGRTLSVGATELAVFVVTLGLVAAASSRAVRARFRDLVSRHLLRSRYDYRTKWLEVTDAFRGVESAEQVLDRLLDALARTFGTGRLSLFLLYDADDRFHQVRSLNIEAPPQPIGKDHPVAAAIARVDEPVELSLAEAGDDPFLAATRAVLGVPLRGAGELLGFVTLGPGPGGEGYDVDDRDLLRAIAHHAGVLLAHARMADDRQASAELDALNRFAAFYLHDFKNLNARLSLVAQNAVKHGDDPEFRAEAMRTVARTSEQMGDLMAQLARRSPGHGRVAAVDLAELARTTLRSLGPDFGFELLPAPGELGQVLAVPEQLQQVLLNILLNAKRATEQAEPKGSVMVRLGGEPGRVRLEVADTGGGIAPERLRTLFQPFQSGAGGFGIGLYESKRIVESYRGTLRVESEVGRGTRVVVELPAVATEAVVGQTSAAAKEKVP